jgi:hypothetical protein
MISVKSVYKMLTKINNQAIVKIKLKKIKKLFMTMKNYFHQMMVAVKNAAYIEF